MAFDAGMVYAIANELKNRIINARIDKIQMPEKEEIVLTLRAERENLRLSLCSAASNPRINLTSENKENPIVAPNFCMLLRKHITGGRIKDIKTIDFERMIRLDIECRDEMGFLCDKSLILEIMGKYSNIIFTSKDMKIISSVKTVDFTTSSKRQVLPGMIYEFPPSQNKLNPLEAEKKDFFDNLEGKSGTFSKFIISTYKGISTLTADEIVYRATGNSDTEICRSYAEKVWKSFEQFIILVKNNEFVPFSLKRDGALFEFSFMEILHYGKSVIAEKNSSFSELIEHYYVKREREQRTKQITSDLMTFLANQESRLVKKKEIQFREMQDAENNFVYKRYGDIVTSNIYRLKRGDKKVLLPDYSSDPPIDVEIQLDFALNPSQNAQKFYKKYNKAKKTIEFLSVQKDKTDSELDYIRSVIDLCFRVENEADLEAIKSELTSAGYGIKNKKRASFSSKTSKPVEFVTENGYKVLCGKNNIQNDELTLKTAEKSDYWFHVKNMPGSHVVLFCQGGMPDNIDLTQAAVIAATYSKANKGDNVAVDYTIVKNVKKPAGSKPGFVIYSTNNTAYVSPDENLCESLRKSK